MKGVSFPCFSEPLISSFMKVCQGNPLGDDKSFKLVEAFYKGGRKTGFRIIARGLGIIGKSHFGNMAGNTLDMQARFNITVG